MIFVIDAGDFIMYQLLQSGGHDVVNHGIPFEYQDIDLFKTMFNEEEKKYITASCVKVAEDSFILTGSESFSKIFNAWFVHTDKKMSKLILCLYKGEIVGYGYRALYSDPDDMGSVVARAAVAIKKEYRRGEYQARPQHGDVQTLVALLGKRLIIDAVKWKIFHPCNDVKVFFTFLSPVPYEKTANHVYGLIPNPDRTSSKLEIENLEDLADRFNLVHVDGKSPLVRQYRVGSKRNRCDYKTSAYTFFNSVVYPNSFEAAESNEGQGHALIAMWPVTFLNLFLTVLKNLGEVIVGRKEKVTEFTSNENRMKCGLYPQ